MSQRAVEIFIGKLLTDDGFRARFQKDRACVVADMEALGIPLTGIEREALFAVDLNCCERLAQKLDPRIRKMNLGGNGLPAPSGAGS